MTCFPHFVSRKVNSPLTFVLLLHLHPWGTPIKARTLIHWLLDKIFHITMGRYKYMWVSVLLMVQLCVELCTSKQFFVMLAPNILHTENDEKIAIQCHECTTNVEVNIFVKNFPKGDRRLHETKTHLTASNNYLATANIKIPSNYISLESNEKQYVIVQASSPSFEIEKVILLSPDTGHILIQTDKTIYTPNQNVNYRIFSTDQNLDPSEQFVTVLIQNPNGIIVNKELKFIPKGIIGLVFKIPELVTVGIWKIIAKFNHAQEKEYTTEFEVQEYVLPTFNVELETEKKFFYYKDEKLIVNIKARYLFGQDVNGHATAIFVLYKDSLTTLHGSITRVEINDGTGSVELKRKHLLEVVSNENELLGHYIYANVTVFSSDGDYVTAHKTNIKIVSSPYTIAFTRTPSYFIPGSPFKLKVAVKNPDMTPAEGVPVVCGTVGGSTTKEGLADLFINTEDSQKELTLTVKTASKDLQQNQQASVTMTAKAYQPTGNPNFLHIRGVVTINDQVNINLQIKSRDKIEASIKYFTILVTSRGKILNTRIQKRAASEGHSAVQFPVTPDMLPSVRIVAYYYTFSSYGLLDLVSDSIWLTTKRTCKGSLEIKSLGTKSIDRPQSKVKLSLSGDKGASVGLMAVDKAVYVLSNKSRLAQEKLWDDVELNDIGCTAGSGANSLGVFQDAGLDFSTNLQIQTQPRKDFACSPGQNGRSRRSTEMLEAKQKKASATPPHLRPCCLAGLHESPMGLPCSKRRKQVQQGKECADVFFECCVHAEELKKRFTTELGWERSDDTEEELEDIAPRTYFPETWIWKLLHLDAESKTESVTAPLELTLPDSITTWVVQAVSIKKDKGICISTPYEITAFKDFFIDLRMPYSVIKNEQVQIRAVIHNYISQDAVVRVKFFYDENICSLATRSRGYQETVRVPAQSSKGIYFVIIPLVATDVYIEVLAVESKLSVSDRVSKKLRVLPEGKLVRKHAYSEVLNPKGSTQRIQIRKESLEGMVPGSIATNFISIQGDVMGETLLGILDHNYLGSLIYVPYGCPEQNMVHTTPNVIVTNYLDATNRWDAIGAEKRSIAINNIKKGYETQISYWHHNSFQGSAWLTAYVVKIFSMALKGNLAYIDENMLCKSALWLVNNQKQNGEFIEPGYVYMKPMQGGYAESESSLTAFVLIALAELGDLCNHAEIKTAIKKAETYLAAELPKLKHTYSAVITSYALSLVGNTENMDKIDSFAIDDRTFWPVEGQYKCSFTAEATGYALLQKLKLRKFEEAHKIAEWLVEERKFGGGYQSTQATAIALQALAQYQMDTREQKDVKLDVQLVVEGRKKPDIYNITNADMYLERTSKIPAEKNIDVEVKGTGKGTITVMTVYQALLTSDKKCNGYTLQAEVTPHEKNEDTYTLTMRTRYRGNIPATMTLIEITMLSGFLPDIEDLKKLADKVENYILKFETQTSASNGTVVLYLTKVPNNEDFQIGFKIHRNFKVGLLQPADITIYEYYDLDKKCSTFYNLTDDGAYLRKICKGVSCKCATENCASFGVIKNAENLKEIACGAGSSFVVKARLTHSSTEGGYDYHNFTIVDVLKEGSAIDVSSINRQRQFLNHMACSQSLTLQTNRDYLIMNPYSNVWELSSSEVYMFSRNTFIVTWEDNITTETFTKTMKENGCNT